MFVPPRRTAVGPRYVTNDHEDLRRGCYRLRARVRSAPTAIVKGTPAARRGRKATALERQRTRGLGHRREGVDRRYLVGRAAAWICFGRHIRHASRTANASSDQKSPAGGEMPKKPIMTLLSTAAMTALAAMSFNISTVVAAPATNEAKAAARSKFTNNAYIVQLAEQPVTAYKGGIDGLQGHQAAQGPEDRPEQPRRRQLRRLPECAAGRRARQRRRRARSSTATATCSTASPPN